MKINHLPSETVDLGLYDSGSENQESVKTLKVSEILHAKGTRFVLAYGWVQRGPLVQIIIPHDETPGGPTIGMMTHYFIRELERVDTKDVLASFARLVAVSRTHLIDIITKEGEPFMAIYKKGDRVKVKDQEATIDEIHYRDGALSVTFEDGSKAVVGMDDPGVSWLRSGKQKAETK